MKTKFSILVIMLILVSAACRILPSPEPELFPTAPIAIQPEAIPTETRPVQAAPVSDSPAAGICAEFDGETVFIKINPDMPDPRCAMLHYGQKLEVSNNRAEVLQVEIGGLEATIQPGESYLFDVPLSDYLLSGVHTINVDPCCGAELWLKPAE